MTEPTNAVLEERINKLTKDFYENKKATNKKFDDMNEKVTTTKELADEVSFTMGYMKESIDTMNDRMTQFITVVGTQNDKIDEFVNSDKRMENKKQITLSTLQVILIIVGMVLGIWGYDQF
ncbi:MAG TPA: hypothetical protein VK094_00440 [Pseudogracilibacillus sp.]|nr:hypothetical protein [Pseudogracilibacillus sp.]